MSKSRQNQAARRRAGAKGTWLRLPPAATAYVLVAVAAAIIRVAVLAQIWHVLPFYRTTWPGFDPDTYNVWAQHIAEGDLLSGHLDRPFYNAPLCPYVLAAVYALAGKGNIVAGIVTNAIFGVWAAVTAAAIARRLFGSGAALAAGLLMALNGAQVSVEAMILNDPWMPAMCLTGLYLVIIGLERMKSGGPDARAAAGQPASARSTTALGGAARPFSGWVWLLAGSLFGLAATGRTSNVLPLLGLMLVAGAPFLKDRNRRRILAAGLLGVGAAAVIALPVLRNGLMYGRWTTVTNGPVNLYLGNAPGAPGYFYFTPEAIEISARAEKAPDQEGLWRAELAKALRRHPGALPMALVRKTQLFLNSWDTADNANYHFVRRYVSSLRLLTFDPLVLYVVGTVGFVLTWRSWRRLTPVYVFALCFAASLIAVLVTGRYKLPFLAVLCIFGGAGVAILLSSLRRRRWKAPLAGAILAAALSAAYWPRPPIGFDMMYVPFRPLDFQVNASALRQHGRDGEAISMLEDGAGLFPHFGVFAGGLAEIDLAHGRPEQALERVGKALRDPDGIRPDDVRQSLLEKRVQALLALRRYDDARRAAADLLRRFPDSQVGRGALPQPETAGASTSKS